MLDKWAAVQASAIILEAFKTSIQKIQLEFCITPFNLNASKIHELMVDLTWPLTGIRNTNESSQVRNAIKKEHKVVLHGY